MARWRNHYEQALHRALSDRGARLVAVDEGSKASPTGRTIKNFDFLWLRDEGPHWLLEVKGRRASATPNAWSTMLDVASLEGWREILGQGYEPLLVFVFAEPETGDGSGEWEPEPMWDCGEWLGSGEGLGGGPGCDFRAHGYAYTAFAVPLSAYQACCRLRSPRWRTLHLPSAAFREHAIPFREWFALVGTGDSSFHGTLGIERNPRN